MTGSFYRPSVDADGRAVVETAERVYGPGWDLDATNPDKRGPIDGWTWYPDEDAFMVSDAAKAMVPFVQRSALLEAGVDVEVVSTILTPQRAAGGPWEPLWARRTPTATATPWPTTGAPGAVPPG